MKQFVKGRRKMSKMEKVQSENPAVPYSGHHTMGMMLVYGYPSHLFPPVKSESYYDGFPIYWLLILVFRLPDRSSPFCGISLRAPYNNYNITFVLG